LPIAIRNAASADAASLARLEELCFSEGYADKMMSEGDFLETILGGNDHILLAELDGRLAGYALLLVRADEREGDFDSLAVAPEFQGKGIGEVLFQSVEAKCQQLELRRLNLEIREDNYTLLKRYHRFGYKCFEIEENFYEDGAGAIRMYKVLG
jgi:[ribosomal protein S18]-alanine N-acetyltransferase